VIRFNIHGITLGMIKTGSSSNYCFSPMSIKQRCEFLVVLRQCTTWSTTYKRAAARCILRGAKVLVILILWEVGCVPDNRRRAWVRRSTDATTDRTSSDSWTPPRQSRTAAKITLNIATAKNIGKMTLNIAENSYNTWLHCVSKNWPLKRLENVTGKVSATWVSQLG